jgi:hypothetical protein
VGVEFFDCCVGHGDRQQTAQENDLHPPILSPTPITYFSSVDWS